MHTLHSFVNFLHALLFYLCVTLRSVNLLRHPAQVTPNTFLHISTHLLILLLSTVYLSATCGSRESTLSPAYCGNLCVVTCAVNQITFYAHSTLYSILIFQLFFLLYSFSKSIRNMRISIVWGQTQEAPCGLQTRAHSFANFLPFTSYFLPIFAPFSIFSVSTCSGAPRRQSLRNPAQVTPD